MSYSESKELLYQRPMYPDASQCPGLEDDTLTIAIAAEIWVLSF